MSISQDDFNAMLWQMEELRTRIEVLEEPKPEEVEEAPPAPPEGLLPKEEILAIKLAKAHKWSADKTWSEGNIVSHNGKLWMALPDVGTHPPDDVYDLDADPQTGGWAPIEY